jgi:hypothetical protein
LEIGRGWGVTPAAPASLYSSAGIFKPNRNTVVVPVPARLHQPGGIGSLELILGLGKSLKSRAQASGHIFKEDVTGFSPT